MSSGTLKWATGLKDEWWCGLEIKDGTLEWVEDLSND